MSTNPWTVAGLPVAVSGPAGFPYRSEWHRHIAAPHGFGDLLLDAKNRERLAGENTRSVRNLDQTAPDEIAIVRGGYRVYGSGDRETT